MPLISLAVSRTRPLDRKNIGSYPRSESFKVGLRPVNSKDRETGK
jgi:hypothetical protein